MLGLRHWRHRPKTQEHRPYLGCAAMQRATRYGTGSLPRAFSTVPPAVKLCVTQLSSPYFSNASASLAAAHVHSDARLAHLLQFRDEALGTAL